MGTLHPWNSNFLSTVEREISARDLHSGYLVHSIHIHLVLLTEYGCTHYLWGVGSACYSAIDIVYSPPKGLVAQLSVACVGVLSVPAH